MNPGTRLGHYEIVAPIGAGGMGEVYRARDTRLDRTVAIKVLPDAFATNSQLKMRFEREAKLISSLSHPNICTLHDVGSEGDVEFLVMEHLDGETLSERLSRGQMPLADVFRYAIEIAQALDRAHRMGIVHRDLKPSNVMITKSGAKLLDFGLAKMSQAGATDVTAALEAPTEKRALTTEGSILGTFQYMSPEQLEGQEADARSDIFAFGAVMYEMLTGRRAFEGKSRASVIASILAAEPAPIAALRPVTPAALDRLVRTCLAKDPDERWQSVHDVRLELEELRSGGGTSHAVATTRRGALVPWLFAAVCALLALATWAYYGRRPHAGEQPSVRASLIAYGLDFNTADGPATISPDGQRIVVRARRVGSGSEFLAVRRLDSDEFTPLQGTERAIDPFWSPDSQQIGFFAEQKIKRIPASGGPITTICDSGSDPRGGTWLGETILFTPAPGRAIHRVNAAGGVAQEAAKIDTSAGEVGQWRPQFLPDGRHYIYLSQRNVAEKSGVFVADLEAKTAPRLVIDAATTAIYAEPGYLLYAYGGDLYAQKFDAGKLEKSGSPLLIAKNVEFSDQFGSTGYSVSRNRSLVFHSWKGEDKSQVVALGLDGSDTPLGFDGDNLDLSHDSTRLAMQRADPTSRAPDLWVHDLKRATRTRLTFEPGADVGPVWSPDDTQIAYVTINTGYCAINIRSSSGAGSVTEVTRSPTGLEITDWSRDGRYLLAEVFSDATAADVAIIDLQGDRKLHTILGNKFAEHSPRFSPDGRFLLYQSNESGQSEIYVQTFPVSTSRWQVTSGGGASGRWSPDGRSIFYLNADRRVVTVSIDTTRGFEIGSPELHGSASSQDITRPAPNGTLYVSRDRSSSDSIMLLTNWDRVLKP